MSWRTTACQETTEIGPQQDRSEPKRGALEDDGTDHAEDIPVIPWQPQDEVSTCEFTHVILDYANKRESGCKKAD